MPRFVIGIGSQRAGSTLLHHLLDASTDIFMHPLKELHYFDTLSGVRSREALKDFSLRQLSREIDKIVSSTRLDFVTRKYKCYLRANKLLGLNPIENIDYLDLFRPFVIQSSILGEITPEYMLLDDASVDKMRMIVGDDAAVILICRNPNKRILSAVKLMNTYNDMGMDDSAAETWLQRMLDEETTWIRAQDRYNDYQSAIDRYSSRFKRFAAISYDSLIKEPERTAATLESVIGTPIDKDSFKSGLSVLRNNLGRSFSISAGTIEKLSTRYAKNLQYLEDYFRSKIVQ